MTDDDPIRARVIEIGSALPEVTVRDQEHASFRVRGRAFAYYLDDHHGDGIVGLACKVEPGRQEDLIAAEPGRFYRPAYVGSRGWVGLDLEAAPLDWDEIEEFIVTAYRLVAPKSLTARLD
jgi:hypothetical protein